MKRRLPLIALTAFLLCNAVAAEEYNFYKYLRYPKELVPGVGRDEIGPVLPDPSVHLDGHAHQRFACS